MGESKKTGKKRRSRFGMVFGVILSILLIGIGVIVWNANRNLKAMNSCMDGAMAQLQRNYTVTPRDVGEYEEMKIYGLLKFHVNQYDIEEVGNLSMMRVNMGFMQMATFVITPRDKNLPLLSADYMYILGNRKCYLEFYDVVKEKDEQYNQLLEALVVALGKYDYLEEIVPSKAWYAPLLTVTSYKAGKADVDKDLEGVLVDSLGAYLEQSKEFAILSQEDKEEKIAITLEYTEGLIKKGGISTDVFKNALGEEETRKFFDNVFFGTTVK